MIRRIAAGDCPHQGPLQNRTISPTSSQMNPSKSGAQPSSCSRSAISV